MGLIIIYDHKRYFNFSKILLEGWALQQLCKNGRTFFIDCHLRSDTEKINDLPKSSTPSVLCCIIPRVRNADIEIVTSPWTCLSLRQPKQQYPWLTATFQISHEYIQCWGREAGWLTRIQNPSCKRVWEKPVLSFPAFAVMEENTRSWEWMLRAK